MPLVQFHNSSSKGEQPTDNKDIKTKNAEEGVFSDQANKWKYFQTQVLPNLPAFQNAISEQAKIWVMCNQNPVELYLLVILIYDYYEAQELRLNFKVLITYDSTSKAQDITEIKWDADFIDKFSQKQINKYFYKREGGYYLHTFFKNHITYLTHDCFDDPPFKEIDLILFKDHIKVRVQENKDKLLGIFALSLKASGMLMVCNDHLMPDFQNDYFICYSKDYAVFQRNATNTQNLFKTKHTSPEANATSIVSKKAKSTLDKIQNLENELITTRKQLGILIEKHNFIEHELKLSNKEVYQKQKELEIEKQFRFLTDYAPVFIWLSKLNKSRYHFNQYWLEFTGRSLSEEAGNGWLDKIHSEDRKSCLDTYEEAYKTQDDFQIFYRLMRYDGIYRWILERGRPRFTNQGTFIGFIGSCIDFTEEKEAKEKLRQSNEELEQFAYVATHDLRAPISNLLSLIDIFYDQGMVTSENNFIMHKIKHSIEEVHHTLHDLIDVVALNRNLDSTIKLLDFQHIYQQVCKGIEEHIQESLAEIKTDFSKAPFIHYIPSHLRSIFQNLLTNAIKYRSPERSPKIEVTTYQLSEYTCISIKDNGRGIDMRKKNKVFGLFQRLHEQEDGKGIGLFVTKSQIESKGGKIDFESELNQGSTFYVYLLNLNNK